MASKITWARKTEAPCEFCIAHISGYLAAKRQKQILIGIPLIKIASVVKKRRSLRLSSVERVREPC
jgi:hypothetical protein